MIEMTLTLQQARKLLRAVNGDREINSTVDRDLADIHTYLAKWIGIADAQRAKLPPWRKVVRQRTDGLYSYDELECGHRYMLRQSSRAGCGWMENHAKKRRCKQCGEG